MTTTTTDPRPDIPLGYTYDPHGRVLTYKDSDGVWREYTRDSHGDALTFKGSDGRWFEYTRDPDGNVLTYKDSTGYWFTCTYDSHGRVLTYKDGKGRWHERTYAPHGHPLTYKDSNGRDLIALAHANDCTLYFDKPTRTYRAGCREFTRAEALEHWGAPRPDNRERAEVFINAINAFEEPQ